MIKFFDEPLDSYNEDEINQYPFKDHVNIILKNLTGEHHAGKKELKCAKLFLRGYAYIMTKIYHFDRCVFCIDLKNNNLRVYRGTDNIPLQYMDGFDLVVSYKKFPKSRDLNTKYLFYKK